MLHDAPQILQALEQSGFAAAIRQSTWAYATANVGHILALTLFAAAVAIMDLRLLGAFAAAPPAAVVRPARRMAVVGLLLMATTGSMLFAAEATHVASNPVFQIKAALIGLEIVNAVLVARVLAPALDAAAGTRAAGGGAIAGDLAVGGRVRAADCVFLARQRHGSAML
jgi:hypothetical protein